MRVTLGHINGIPDIGVLDSKVQLYYVRFYMPNVH